MFPQERNFSINEIGSNKSPMFSINMNQPTTQKFIKKQSLVTPDPRVTAFANKQSDSEKHDLILVENVHEADIIKLRPNGRKKTFPLGAAPK